MSAGFCPVSREVVTHFSHVLQEEEML